MSPVGGTLERVVKLEGDEGHPFFFFFFNFSFPVNSLISVQCSPGLFFHLSFAVLSGQKLNSFCHFPVPKTADTES